MTEEARSARGRRVLAPGRCWMAACVVAAALASQPASAADTTCVGDCNGDATVSINELILGVNIALATTPLSACAAFDANGSGDLTIDELVRGVTNALNGCAGDTVSQGLRALSTGNLVSAQAIFAAAAGARPDDGAAQLYALFSRLALELLTNDRLLASLAATGARLDGGPTQLCGLRTSRPIIVPADAPTLDAVVSVMRDVLQPRVQGVAAGLQTASGDGTTVALDTRYFPACVEPPISLPILDIDRGDFLAGRAALLALDGLIDLGGAYHVEIGMSDLINGPIAPAVAADGQLFTLRSADQLTAARNAFEAALDTAMAALEEIRSEQDDQDDDLLVVMDEDAAEVDRYAQLAASIRQSLRGEVVIPAQDGLPHSQRLNLGRLFDGSIPSLRPYLAFTIEGNIDIRHFPDPTFGGITPDLTQADIDQLIDGGRLCALCTEDQECAGFGPQKLYCGYCYADCAMVTMRCVGNGASRCADGIYF